MSSTNNVTNSAGNNLVYITTSNANSSLSIAFVGLSNSYTYYQFVMNNLAFSTTSQSFFCQFQAAGAFATTGYYYSAVGLPLSSAPVFSQIYGTNTSSIILGNTSANYTGTVNLFDLGGGVAGSPELIYSCQTYIASGSSYGLQLGGGIHPGVITTTGIKFQPTSGTILTGSIALYGINT